MRSLEFSAPAPCCSPEMGRGLEMELMIDGAYVRIHKIPTGWGLRLFQLVLLEDDAPQFHGFRSLWTCSSGCLSASLILSFNKLVNVLPWVLWVVLGSYCKQKGGGHGYLWFVATSDRSCGSPGDPLLAFGICWWVGYLMELSPYPVGSDAVSWQEMMTLAQGSSTTQSDSMPNSTPLIWTARGPSSGPPQLLGGEQRIQEQKSQKGGASNSVDASAQIRSIRILNFFSSRTVRKTKKQATDWKKTCLMKGYIQRDKNF